MRFGSCARALVLGLLVAGTPALHAADRPLRWSSAGDILTFDFHAASDSFSQNVGGLIYEQLVRRGKDMNFEPGLALSWEVRDPLRWRLRLREGVKFTDGSPLTADDVVFPVQRSQHPNASSRALTTRLGHPNKIDNLTVEVVLDTPNPVLLAYLIPLHRQMLPWAMRNGAQVVHTPWNALNLRRVRMDWLRLGSAGSRAACRHGRGG